MIWQRIEPTTSDQEMRSRSGACEFCGDRSSAAGCVCRYCDSCSSYWTTGGKRDAVEEDGPTREDCPECVAWAASPEGKAELERQRLARREEERDDGPDGNCPGCGGSCARACR